MLICQWHLDIVYGKPAEAVRIMRAWGGREVRCMAAPQFRAHSDALAPFIVPGSQRWVVYRVLEQ
jgi:hypothetical protein